MKTRLLLLVKLRIEVDTTKKAKHNLRKYLVFGHIVKVLFHLVDAVGKLYKMIRLNRLAALHFPSVFIAEAMPHSIASVFL